MTGKRAIKGEVEHVADSSVWCWKLPGRRTFDAIDLAEDICNGLRVKSWKAFADRREIAHGGQIGYRRIARLEAPVTADEVRVEVASYGKATLHLSLRIVPPQDGAVESAVRPTASSMAFKALPAPKGELVADFGNAVEVVGFAFTPGTCNEVPPKGYHAQASDDAKTWRDLDSDEFSNILANPIRQDIRFPSSATTRYIRLVAVPFHGESTDWSAPGAKVEFIAP